MNIVYSCIIPIWEARFVLIVGEDVDFLRKKLEHKLGKNETEILSRSLSIGATQYFTCTKNGINYQVFGIRLVRTDDITIHHEAVHCAWDILDQRGVTVEYKNHEALTYLSDYIAKIIKDQLHK